MPKRDRWSSDDDEGDEVGNDNGQSDRQLMTATASSSSHLRSPPTKTEEIIPASTNKTQAELSSSSSSSSSYRTHNPLLQGCRSIYTSYERLSHLDEGSYGVVWKAKCLQTSEIVAIKQIKFDTQLTKDGFPISALREISVLLHLSHVNIIPVYEMVTGSTPDKVFMVMECMECDLQSAMTSRQSSTHHHHNNGGSSSSNYNTTTQPFAQSEIKYMIYQLLCAISHVHTHWYMHRDIKTSNILIHQSGKLALCDFGLARKYVLPITNKLMTSMVVTLWYRSIELLFGECYYGPEIDIWSVGCVFGELVCMDAILKGNGELDVSIQHTYRLLKYIVISN
jgi:cell division cycle 2-like protein